MSRNQLHDSNISHITQGSERVSSGGSRRICEENFLGDLAPKGKGVSVCACMCVCMCVPMCARSPDRPHQEKGASGLQCNGLQNLMYVLLGNILGERGADYVLWSG